MKKLRILAVVLLLLLLPAILAFTAVSLPNIYQESYYAELAEMTRRMEEEQRRKKALEQVTKPVPPQFDK